MAGGATVDFIDPDTLKSWREAGTVDLYDVREEAVRPFLERQARRAATPRELADACDTVVVSLPTLPVFRQALSGPDGLLSGKALKTLVNTCTVGGPFVAEVWSAATPIRYQPSASGWISVSDTVPEPLLPVVIRVPVARLTSAYPPCARVSALHSTRTLLAAPALTNTLAALV